MLESAWLFLGLMAFVMTLVALFAPAWATARGGDGDGLAIICGVVGFVLWGVWTFGTLEIVVISQGSELVYAESELTFLGVILALVPGYVALTGPIELVGRAFDPTLDDL